MDIATSLAPRSDQINADDLVAGPMTVTIREVVGGKGDQPYDFLLVETERAYRPNVTMRRLISSAWGTTDGDQFAGRRLRLYCAKVPDPGGKGLTNGIRVSHVSHIDKRFEVKLQVTRGKRETFTVEPLIETAPPQPAATSPVAALLAQIKEAAAAAQVDIATIAKEWAETHDGQNIREATDLGSLELIRDDLHAKVATPGPTGPSA